MPRGFARERVQCQDLGACETDCRVCGSLGAVIVATPIYPALSSNYPNTCQVNPYKCFHLLVTFLPVKYEVFNAPSLSLIIRFTH